MLWVELVLSKCVCVTWPPQLVTHISVLLLTQTLLKLTQPCSVLTKSIPNLGNFVENAYTYTCNDQVSQQVLLCKLISAIADQRNPIVIVFDDLQWADETSLNVLQMIATDPDITYCLCIGCYRDNDPTLTQKVTNMVNGIKNLHVSVMAINLGKRKR